MCAYKRRRQFDKGKWAIQRERFQTDARQPPPDDFHEHTLGDFVPKVMKGFGLEGRVWEQQITDNWAKLVGPQIAQHTKPGRINYGTLIVFVSSSAWLSELVRYGQKQILDKLHARFGAKKIKGIRFQLDPDGTEYGK